MKNIKFVVVPLGTEETRFIEAANRRNAEDIYKGYEFARLEKWNINEGTARTLKEKTKKNEETFFFDNCSVCVVNHPPIRVAGVYKLDGVLVHIIQTTTKGLTAANLAKSDAIRSNHL